MLAGPGLAIHSAGYIVPTKALPPDAVRRSLDAGATDFAPYPARHGARHAAGLSFAYQNPGGVAFIVSEDGPVSCALRLGEHVYVWPVRILET